MPLVYVLSWGGDFYLNDMKKKTGRYEGRMTRSAFWNRMIPLNVFFNIVVIGIDNYYANLMEKGLAETLSSVEVAAGDISEEFAISILTQIYGYVLPMVGWLLLAYVIYYFIVSPWIIKRMHDIGMSGGWFSLCVIATLISLGCVLIVPLIPSAHYVGLAIRIIVAIFIIICGLRDSQYAANRYGESPKYGKYKKPLPEVPKA